MVEKTPKIERRGGPRPKVREDDQRGAKPGQKGQEGHEPTEETRAYVREHAVTFTHPFLARMLGISVNTLLRHYRPEIDQRLSEEVHKIGSAIVRQANEGDRGSQYYFMRTRGMWGRDQLHGESSNAEDAIRQGFAVDPEVIASLNPEEFALYERLCDKLRGANAQGTDTGPDSADSGEGDQAAPAR